MVKNKNYTGSKVVPNLIGPAKNPGASNGAKGSYVHDVQLYAQDERHVI